MTTNNHKIRQYTLGLVLMICSFGLNLHGQNIAPVTSSLDNRTIANDLYEEERYYEAIPYYLKAEEESGRRTNSAIKFKLADCYRHCRLYKDAAKYYQEVVDEDDRGYPMARFWLGQMQMAVEDYQDALENYKYLQEHESRLEKEYIQVVNSEVKACKLALQSLEKDHEYEIKPLSDEVNDEFSNSGPMLHRDTLYFSSTISGVRNKEKLYFEGAKGKYDEYYVQRLFQSVASSGKWQEKLELKLELEDEFSHVLSPFYDVKSGELFFTVCQVEDANKNYQLYSAKPGKKGFSDPVKLPSPVNTGNSSSRDAMLVDIENTSYMFFSSNRDGGEGGYDIYVATRNPSGGFTNLKNLGPLINTVADEICPFHDESQSYFYFSSNKPGGFGGFDIYKAPGEPEGSWKSVDNYGYPVNSGADDCHYFQNHLGEGQYKAYFSSNRINDRGQTGCCDNIYSFSYSGKQNEVIPAVSLVLVSKIKNKDNLQELQGVSVKLFDAYSKERINSSVTNNAGEARFDIFKDSAYYLEIKMEGFEEMQVSVNNFGVEDSFVIENILMEKAVIIPDEPDVPDPVASIELVYPTLYWDFNQYKITSREKAKLDKFAEALKVHDQVDIYVASHTDNLDNKGYNMTLSRKRTESVISYLVGKGIDPARITGQWYGEEKPIVSNQTQSGRDNPDGRARNRRTETGPASDMQGKGQMVSIDKELKITSGRQDEGAILDEETFRRVLAKYGNTTHEDLLYKVQVGAYVNAEANLRAKMQVYAKLQEDVAAFIQREQGEKYTKFMIGKPRTLNEAYDIQKKAEKIGIRSAFIVPYYKGKRIKMIDAMEVLGQTGQ